MDWEVVTAIGTPNIALTKYWGKRDDKLILPMNSSISITLGEQLNTKTSVLFSDKFKSDKLYINGELQNMGDKELSDRFQMLNRMRGMAKSDAKALVVSYNSFPTASGLASSASGMATLAFAASKALGLNLSTKDLSILARMGSGSACRSVLGGIVEWKKGTKSDGSDSYAEQIVDEKYWPELIDIVSIVTVAKKKVSSTAGMKQTVANGILYKGRPEYVEKANLWLIDAIKKRDFKTLAEITMRDSNNLHSVMLDTWPPIIYLSDVSKNIIYKIHELNDAAGEPVAAYTFDAGANANIITLAKHSALVTKALKEVEGVTKTIRLAAGGGPRLLAEKDSLIDERHLSPK